MGITNGLSNSDAVIAVDANDSDADGYSNHFEATDTVLFHLTRMNHMALSCIGCGMCTSACPADLPVGRVFRAVGDSVQATFEYVPGLDPSQELPLITFEENEWLEVGA